MTRTLFRRTAFALFCVGATAAPSFAAVDSSIKVVLEEPGAETMTGIRNMRGWALGDEGIDYVVWYLDGVEQGRIPYGGSRGDVQGLHPDYPDSEFPGFSQAWNYALWEPGEHTVRVRAYDLLGNHNEAEVTFSVARFGEKRFLRASDLSMTEFVLPRLKIKDDHAYTIRLEWSQAVQQFVIRDIVDEGFLFLAPGSGPTGLTATKTDGDVELSWTDITDGETGFYIERRMNTPTVDGTWERIGTVSSNMEGFLDTSVNLDCVAGLSCGVFEYRVFSFVPIGSSFASNVAAVHQDPILLVPDELDPLPPLPPVPESPLPPLPPGI